MVGQAEQARLGPDSQAAQSKRWQASYVGPDRARHPRRTPSPRRWTPNGGSPTSAGLIERDEWTPPSARQAVTKARGVTLGEYATTWLAQRPLKHRTRAHYASLLANHITPGLGRLELRHLTAAAVRAWHSSLDPARRTANSHAYALLHGICAQRGGRRAAD